LADAAAEAAVRAYEQHMIARVVQSGHEYIAATPDDHGEHSAAAKAGIRWFLERLERDLPSEALGTRYEPRDGDLVQLTLAGEVYVDVSTCGHCGNPSDASWTVVMDSGDEYEFSLEDLGRMQVRVITTNREVGEETR
jgi:hypothetical protein